MIVQKKFSRKRNVKAASRLNRARRIRANDEEARSVDVAEEASDLLFEAEDVAELIAEVTGTDVAVTAEDDVVTFEVGEDAFTIEAEGDEEILESTRKRFKNKPSIRASRTARRMKRR